MQYQSSKDVNELTPSNISASSRSFEHLQENMSKSHSLNSKSLSGQKETNISCIDLECSLFMDETNEDLDNYLNITLPECSKSFSGNDDSLNQQDFESKTMNHLSRNIKGKYQKNVRGLKKNNKFFKSKTTVENNWMDPNEIPVINEAMRKIFKPVIDKPDIKSTPKISLKTYSNKYKKKRDIQIVESFGLPDEPLVPVLNLCAIEQDPANLDVDKGNLNNMLLSSPWTIDNQIDTTINIAQDFRRRSFSLFEDRVPSVGNSLEDEVKEGFNFEETAEIETTIIPKSKQMLLQDLRDKSVREPKILLKPLNLDDHQVFRANNLSPIKNRKKLLLQRLRSYSRTIEDTQMHLSVYPGDVNSTKRDERNAQTKNNCVDRDDNLKSIDNTGDSVRLHGTLKSKINSRRSARLQHIHEKGNDEQINNLIINKDNSHVEARNQCISSEGSSLLKSPIKMTRIHSSIKPDETNKLTLGRVDNNNINLNSKKLDVGSEKKISADKNNSYSENNSSIDDILLSPKRITRQSAHDLVVEKLLNTFDNAVDRQPDRNGDQITTKNVVKDQIGYKSEKDKELKKNKNLGIILPKSSQKKLEYKELTEEKISVYNTSGKNILVKSKEEKNISKKKKQSNVMANDTCTSITYTCDSQQRNGTISKTILSDEEQIFSGSFENEEIINNKLGVEELSLFKGTNLRRSRRGIQTNLEDPDKEDDINRNMHNLVTNPKNSQEISSNRTIIEENIKVFTQPIEYSLQNRSHEGDILKKKQHNCHENHNMLEATERIKRISDRLRSKSSQRLSIPERTSIKAPLIKKLDCLDTETENSLSDSYAKKSNGLISGSMKLNQNTKNDNEISPGDKMETINCLKSPTFIKKQPKKSSEPNKPSEIHSGDEICSYKHNANTINHVKSPKLNEDNELIRIQAKPKALDDLKSVLPNGYHLNLSNAESLAPVKKHMKRFNEIILSPKQNSIKLKCSLKDIQKPLDLLKSQITQENKQKLVFEVSPPTEEESFEAVSDSKITQKIPRSLKLSRINKNQQKESEPTKIAFDSEDTYKMQTRSKSPKKVQQKKNLSKEEPIVEVISSKSHQKMLNRLKSGVNHKTHLTQGNLLSELFEAENIEMKKRKKQNISELSSKNHHRNGKKLSVEGKSTKSKFCFEKRQKMQNLSKSPVTNKIQPKKDNKYCNTSEIESSETVLDFEDKKNTPDSVKISMSVKKGDKLIEQSKEAFDKVMFSKNKPKMLNLSMSPTVNKINKKGYELSESPPHSIQTSFVSNINEKPMVPDTSDSKKKETLAEFCKIELNSNDASTTEVSSESAFITTEANSELINFKERQETLAFPNKQLSDKNHPEILDKPSESSTAETTKNNSRTIEGLELPSYEKIEHILNHNEISTEDTLIPEGMPRTLEHLITILPHKDNHKQSDEYNEPSAKLAKKKFCSKNKIDLETPKTVHRDQSDELNDLAVKGSTFEQTLNKYSSSPPAHDCKQKKRNKNVKLSEKESIDILQHSSLPNEITIENQTEKHCLMNVQKNEKKIVCTSGIEELTFNEFNEIETQNEKERQNGIEDNYFSEVLSDPGEICPNTKNSNAGLEVTIPISFDGATNLSNDEEKLIQHEEEDDIQTEEMINPCINVEKLPFKHNPNLSIDFYKIESKEVNVDFKISDKAYEEHLSSLFLKKDECALKDQLQLRVCDDLINEADIIPYTKLGKKAENLDNSPVIFDNKNSEINDYSKKNEFEESNNQIKIGELKEYLDVGYDIHRRTSFRKILERVMEMSKLEMEINQKEACRLKRCKSVPHEKFNYTKTTSTTPISSSVDNTFKYLGSDKNPITKKIDFSKVKKRLDYFADSNISDLKRTKRSGVKSMHITQLVLGSEPIHFEGMYSSSSEIQNTQDNVVNESGSTVQKDLTHKKRKRRCVSESDKRSERTNGENARCSGVLSFSEDKPARLSLIDTQYNPTSKSDNLTAEDDENSNVNQEADEKITKEDNSFRANREVEHSELSDQLISTSKILEEIDSVMPDTEFERSNETDVSVGSCRSVIGRPKKMSKRDSRRLSRISQLEKSGNEGPGSVNSLGSCVNSKAARKVLYEFKVGDSIWGKVGNYPYWPCVIVLDPETSEFKKYKLLRTTPYYHVRFFGDKGKRAWTTHVIPYEGPDDLDNLAKKFWREGVQTSYIKECYCIKPAQYDKWKNAVSEAETMKNESVEYKINFFKGLFGGANHSSGDEEASESSSIKTSASVSRRKKKKKEKITQKGGNKSSQLENKKNPMKIASVLSCINNVISEQCTSGDDDNSVQETDTVKKELTSRRKRKRKKKVIDNSDLQDFHEDLGIELLNLPPVSSLTAASESNNSKSCKDFPRENKSFISTMISAQTYSTPGRNKIINEDILKVENENAALNNSLSVEGSSIKTKSSRESVRMRSRSLPRIVKHTAKDDTLEKLEFCTPSTGPVLNSISNLIFSPPKLREKKQALTADQSDSESRASDNSFVNCNVYQLSQFKKNLFRGVTKDKVCQICEKPVDVVKCRGPCNGDYHIKCVENSLEITKKKVADQHKNESVVCDRNNDAKNEQVQIITVSSGKKLLDNLTLSPRNKETSLTETQIDRKMKEVMNQIESNGSYNAEFMESTDSGGDEVNFDCKLKVDSSKSNATSKSSNNYRNSDKPQKSKGIFKHVTADDISIISITEDGTVKSKSVFNEINTYRKETPSVDECAYKCPYCTSSVVPPCFVCNSIISMKGSTMRQRCSVQKCGRFFHLDCLNIWPQTQWSFILHEKRKSEALDSFVCPRHVCHTCASENLGSSIGRCPNDKLVKCLRCPATYHNSYHCVPAGSHILTSMQIICPRHVQEKSRRPVTCNTIWCFVCSEGGNLICCETCPTSVHAECLHVKFMDDDSYICEDCESGRFPLYDEVVWVKCGTFRWWPAIILFPSEVPANVEAKPHSEGDFVVKFFGTYDYYWVGRGRTFLYQEGDTGYLNSNKNRIDEAFSRALKEAADVYRLKQESKSKRDMEVNNGLRPPSYVRIKVNRPVGNVRVFEGNLSNTTSCDCDPRDLNPCGPNSNCLNRILLTECNPEVCPSGRKCNNQSFEKREYPQVVPYRTEGRGWGLKTMEFIQKGQFIIEYVGEIIDDEEYQRRIKRMHQQKDENYYFLTIDNNRMLDAGPKGNAARFMNHSCQPNCETQKWTVNGDTRVGLFAIEDIVADTELTFNYNLQCAGTEKKICRCGAPNCSGYIGVKPDDQKPPRRIRKEKKKEIESREEIVNESSCFVCGKNGDVGVCTNKLCLKSYHLKCVQLDSWPERKWNCPSHSCNICSRRTTRSCVQCTNSYCPEHSNNKIRYDSQLGFVCSVHDPTKKKRGRPRKKSISQNVEISPITQRGLTTAESKKNLYVENSESLSSRSERYRKRRNVQTEEEPSPKKLKLAN